MLELKNLKMTEDLHQVIMGKCYEVFQNDKEITYEDMLNYSKENYGTAAEFAVMIGNYNYQVENGGHVQYFYNGYASKETCGFGAYYFEFENAVKLLALSEEFKQSIKNTIELVIFNRYLGILKSFIEDSDIDTDATIEDYIEDEETGEGYYEDVQNEEYGKITIPDDLDNKYYEINNSLMKIVNKTLKTMVR